VGGHPDTLSNRSTGLVRKAYAKINLALAVDRPIEAGPNQGMHPIASWMVCVELADEVRVRRLPERSPAEVRIRGEGVAIDWPVWDDIAFGAVRLLEQEARRPLPVEVEIVKRVPAGGGLGGGSSDGATVLRAVDELLGPDFGLGLGVPRLREVSARLGSDVAFFLDEGVGADEPPRPALVTALGDQIERLKRMHEPVTLICPGFGCPTKDVYRAFDGQDLCRFRSGEVESMARSGVVEAEQLFNDLAGPACVVRPELGRLIERVGRASGRRACVSGSGSTVFVVGGSAGEDFAELEGARVIRTRMG
jgi:4-diphosphocytidyl-2-C-methyl-D-erythritol kinase